MACQILIVDDDPDIREALAELLEAEGYRCTNAANGREALDYLRAQPSPDLILLDLMMPVMDGFEFRSAQLELERLREIPVVVISASGRSRHAARDLGAADYLEKPIHIPLLLQKVRTICSQPAEH
ncbi:MAG: response regulator [Deltaproteobacteria bacterium]